MLMLFIYYFHRYKNCCGYGIAATDALKLKSVTVLYYDLFSVSMWKHCLNEVRKFVRLHTCFLIHPV